MGVRFSDPQLLISRVWTLVKSANVGMSLCGSTEEARERERDWRRVVEDRMLTRASVQLKVSTHETLCSVQTERDTMNGP